MILDKATILLVDDRPEGLITLQAVLHSQNYNLVTAQSGHEALAYLADHDVALILLDVQMPGMDGFETATKIKLIPRLKDTPIVFVTAINKDTAYIHRGYDSGAIDYVLKPFDPYILKSKVAMLVDSYNKTVQIKRQAALLKKNDERLRAALTASETGTYRWEFKTQAMEWDENLDLLLDLTPRQTAHWLPQFIEQIDPRDRGPVIAGLEECATDGTDFNMEFRILKSDGTVRWLSSKGKTFFDEQEKPLYMTGACMDITKFKEALESLDEKNQELARSNADLEQFAYVASHDLQEPLRNVTSYAQLLASRYRGRLDENADNFIGFLVDGALRMQRLIQDLLAYSRIRQNDLNIKVTDLNTVVKKIVTDLNSQDEPEKVILADRLPSVFADSLQMHQLFQNLLSNALKFKGADVPRINISAVHKDKEWLFAVRDNGIGIEPQYSERIFVIFQRLHGQHEFPGTGIGLAICKKIVERHGGKIWVDSQPGHGSTFFFTLPVSPLDSFSHNGNGHAAPEDLDRLQEPSVS